MLVMYSMSLSSDSSDSSLRLLTLLLHFAAKWFLPLHLAHVAPHAGHLPLSKTWIWPQNLHVFPSFSTNIRFFFDLSKRLFGSCHLSFIPCTSSLCAAEIVFNCEFVASVLLQMSIHFFRSSFLSCSSCLRVCLSRTPRTIRSRRMELCIQSQKLHVFASVCRPVGVKVIVSFKRLI